MSKFVCPYCFKKNNRYKMEFHCKCGETFIPFANPLRHLLFAPEERKCPKCGEISRRTHCPSCHCQVDNNMVRKKSHIISIIGAESSGKTTYITTIIKELYDNFHKVFGIGVSPVNYKNRFNGIESTTEERYMKDFYERLYVNKLCPAPTEPTDKRNGFPLVYKVNGDKDNLYLVFYDTAGENFHNPNNIADNVKFINESDALIFLLDTDSIPFVNQRLGINKTINLHFDTIISNVIAHFEQGEKKTMKKFFKMPIAFVFSKFDMILSHPELFQDCSIPNLSLETNSFYLNSGEVLINEFEGISSGIIEALKVWGENNFLSNIKKFRNAKCFGISALGKEPISGRVDTIQPYRVLDPLVWIMTQLNFPIPIANIK